MGLSDVRGISFPFRFGANGHLVRSSGVAKIEDNLKALISIRIGEVPMEPEKGTTSYDRVFRNGGVSQQRVVEQLIRDGIAKHEPRVLVRRVSVSTEEVQAGNAMFVEVWYKFRDTQQEGNFKLRIGGDV